MTVATPAPVAFCSRCGKPAPIVSATMDPRYPLVRCSRTGDDGRELGHGTLAGLLDADRADYIREQRSREQTLRAHPLHEARGRPNPRCAKCQAAAPAPKVRAHPLELIRSRYRLVGHLDLAHGDRSMVPRMQTRPYEEIAQRHAELHGETRALV